MECEHKLGGACKIIGELAGSDPVDVDDKICGLCAKSDKPGPKQKNHVTASMAIRHCRKVMGKGYLQERMPIIRPFIDSEGCTHRKKAARADKRTADKQVASKKLDDRVKRLLLRSFISPGDIMTMTAAVESLHGAYPGRWETDVETSCPEIWEHNPNITHMSPEERQEALYVDMEYPAIQQSDQVLQPFLGGYAEFLGGILGVHLPLLVNKPQIYLTEEEIAWKSQVAEICGMTPKYWVVNAGIKSCFTAKQWPVEYYQEVIDATRHKWEWVQIGQTKDGHTHPDLKNVIDLRDKTSIRELFRLVYHSQGGLGPITFLQHVCAALDRPYGCIAGGREPVSWIQYPLQQTFHTLGQLDCCKLKACWKSRTVPIGDGKDSESSLCLNPSVSWKQPVPRCMTLIKPETVIQTLERY